MHVGGSKTIDRIAQNFLNSYKSIEAFDKRNKAPWFVILSMPSPKDFSLGRRGRVNRVEI